MQQNNPFENKVTKTKKLGKDAFLQVSANEITRRILVDFSSIDGRIKVQRSFQDNIEGRKESKKFENAFKSLYDIKKYLGFF